MIGLPFGLQGSGDFLQFGCDVFLVFAYLSFDRFDDLFVHLLGLMLIAGGDCGFCFIEKIC